jgi:hypothetical protein
MSTRRSAHDPQYPYNRPWERLAMRDVDMYEPRRVALYNSKLNALDDYNPERHERLYHLPKGQRPFRDGDGAIYSLEYLTRRHGA